MEMEMRKKYFLIIGISDRDGENIEDEKHDAHILAR